MCLLEESISRDVTFDENVFPFSKLHANAGARLRPEHLLLSEQVTTSMGDNSSDDQLTNSPVYYSNLVDLSDVAQQKTGSHDRIETGGISALGSVPAMLHRVPGPDSPVHDSGGTKLPAADDPHAPVDTRESGGEQQRATSPLPTDSPTVVHAKQENVQENPAGVPEQISRARSSTAEAVRPNTRLQSGIRKTKVYTDDTIKQGCFTSSGQP